MNKMHFSKTVTDMGWKKIMKLLVVILIATTPSYLCAKELYVNSTNGNDAVSYAQNGPDSPWRSLGRALWGNVSISSPNSGEAARAGDIVNVAEGVYNTTAATDARYVPIYNPVNSGTAEAPIVIRAVGTVHLQSNQSTGTQPIIGALNRSHIVWSGFTINEETVPTRRDTGPVVVWNSSHITLEQLNIAGIVQNWGDNHNGIRIEQSNNIVVRNCLIEGFYESHGGAITTYKTGRLVIENNDINNAQDAIFIKGENPGPVTIRYNRVNNTKNGIMFGGIGLSGEMSRVYQNIITNSELGGIIFIGYDSLTPAHVTVANNVIHVASPNSDGGGILLRPQYTGYNNLHFFNNIITGSSAGVTAWGTELNATTFSFNNYYNNARIAWIGYQDQTLTSWRNNFGQDREGTVTVNPRYTDYENFRLSSDSPLLTAGRDFLDLNGNGSTTDSIPMGAYISVNDTIGRLTGLSAPADFRRIP
jgi:hypothetical protein